MPIGPAASRLLPYSLSRGASQRNSPTLTLRRYLPSDKWYWAGIGGMLPVIALASDRRSALVSLDTQADQKHLELEAPRPPASTLLRRWQQLTLAHWPVLPLWMREVLALFVASRVAFLLVNYVGYVLILAPKYSTGSVGVVGLLHAWEQWDARWYLGIAMQGYTSSASTAFFPLYPLLIAGATAPFHGAGSYTAGLLISNLAFLGALLLLYRLVAGRWGGETARRAVLYLTVFPTALYTFAPYNESLFLLLSLGCFAALERRRWALAGALGALAVLTRSAGLLLLIPFAYEWWRAQRGADAHGPVAGRAGMWDAAADQSLLELPATTMPAYTLARSAAAPNSLGGVDAAHAPPRPLWAGVQSVGAAFGERLWAERRALATPRLCAVARLGWALLLPASVGLYATYCAWRFGDALAFAHAQVHWYRIITWPWVSLWWQLAGLAQAAPASFFQVHDLIDLGATLLFLGLLVVGWRRLPRAQSLYMGALLVLILIEPGGVATHLRDALTSNARFVLEAFPGFITLAILTARRPGWHQAIVVVSALLLATLTLVFLLGRWLV
jgi:hypothetical protein